MTDQTDLLSEVNYKLESLIKLVKGLRLVVDADSLERAITHAQRTHERNYGGV